MRTACRPVGGEGRTKGRGERIMLRGVDKERAWNGERLGSRREEAGTGQKSPLFCPILPYRERERGRLVLRIKTVRLCVSNRHKRQAPPCTFIIRKKSVLVLFYLSDIQ